MPTLPKLTEERITYVALLSLFLSLFAGFSWYKSHHRQPIILKPFDLALLGFATFRLGRLATYDKVTEPLRRPFTRTQPDPSGVGDTVAPKGAGMQRALGELFACPICTGTWIAAMLVYGLNLIPGPTRAFLGMMSAIGIAELLNAATEALQWTGAAERREAGAKS
ncbi:MAG: DUF1360 domain-containing protein [Anaerolineae bacterium]|nr:DUF1360 domain-containing protein [Anaerolineae bacterium]